MNYRSWSGSLGNSSTASRSSDPREMISHRETYFPARSSSLHIHSFLLTLLSVSMSYLIIAVPMRNSLRKHSCMSIIFPIAILKGTCMSIIFPIAILKGTSMSIIFPIAILKGTCISIIFPIAILKGIYLRFSFSDKIWYIRVLIN